MVTAGMSISEKEEALAYAFGLGKASPKEWHLREVTLDVGKSVKTHLQDLLIDIPVQHRASYCVTSGHKVNLDPKRNSCQIKKFGKNLMQLLDIQCRQTTSLEKTMQSW